MYALKKYNSYTLNNKVRVVRSGVDYFGLAEKMIACAKLSIHLQCYIFNSDVTGSQIANALFEAGRRGVKVFILVDGYGSKNISSELRARLSSAPGIHFNFFQPLLKSRSFYFGRRLHHKVLVVDAKECLVGGLNIADRYNDMYGEKTWLDWAIHVQGEAALEVYKVCTDVWNHNNKKKKREIIHAKNEIDPLYKCPVKVMVNDWVRRKNQITKSYKHWFQKVNNEIIMVSGYFIPGRIIRRVLSVASEKGVNIKVIVAGTSDVGLAKNAERFMYRWLLKHHVEIYEYQGSVLHGKMAVFDRKCIIIGSYNINDISAYASIEMNIEVMSNSLALCVAKELESIINTECVQIKEVEVNSATLIARLRQRVSYLLFRAILFLFTFYFKQANE